MRVRHIVAGALLLASGASAADPFEEERQALAKAKAQAVVAEERAAKIDALADAEASEADAARAKAAAVAARIQATEADMSAAEARIRLIEKLRAEQRALLAAKQEPVVRLLAAIQSLTRKPTGLMLLQPGSTRDAVHLRAVLSNVVPVLRQRTASLRAEIAKGERLKQDAGRAVGLLAAAKSRLAEQRQELVNLSTRHRATADKLTGDALAEQDRAIGYGEDARDIGALMDSLERDAGQRTRLARLPGPVLRPARPGDVPVESAAVEAPQNQLPYRLPVTGALVAGMGDVSDVGVRSRGITIAPRAEALVVAPSSGRVVFAGPFKGYGRIVILDHGSGWTSLLTSMAVLFVQVGDQVIQGSPLGRVGGGRPTVTVELRRGDRAVDIAGLVR